jgi:PIN domain nuclease of toxin-antitoxin system
MIAYLDNEPGHGVVRELLDSSIWSTVNAAEVATKFADRGVPEQKTQRILKATGVPTVTFEDAHVYRTGSLRDQTRKAGLSLGDRACLATAELLGTTAVTADKAWKKLRLPVKVKVIR